MLRVLVPLHVLLVLSRGPLGIVSLQTGASFPRRGGQLRGNLLDGVVGAVRAAGRDARCVGGVRLIAVQAVEQAVGQRVVVQDIQVGLGLLEITRPRREAQVDRAGRQDASRQQVFPKRARDRHGALLRRRGATLGDAEIIVAAVLLGRVVALRRIAAVNVGVRHDVTRRVVRVVAAR